MRRHLNEENPFLDFPILRDILPEYSESTKSNRLPQEVMKKSDYMSSLLTEWLVTV
jgi:hypothetical protein